MPKATGRMVVIHTDAAADAAARQQVTTAADRQVRRAHPASERNLAAVVRQHAGRWARYRGRARNRIQSRLIGRVVNVNRMVRRLLGPAQGAAP